MKINYRYRTVTLDLPDSVLDELAERVEHGRFVARQALKGSVSPNTVTPARVVELALLHYLDLVRAGA